MRRVIAPILLALFATWGAYAELEKKDGFAPIRFLPGRWQGTSAGEPGEGTLVREYEPVLGDRFIREHNVSTYPAQEKNPSGEVHEHFSFFSYDRRRDRIVFRQFHQESFVITYVLDNAASTSSKLVFVSEAFENLDPAFRARETYEFVSNDEFTETFEVAEPGKEFEVYSRAHLRRASP